MSFHRVHCFRLLILSLLLALPLFADTANRPIDDHRARGSAVPTTTRATLAEEVVPGDCPEKLPAREKAELAFRAEQLLDQYYAGKKNRDELSREMASAMRAANPRKDKDIDAEIGLELQKLDSLKEKLKYNVLVRQAH